VWEEERKCFSSLCNTVEGNNRNKDVRSRYEKLGQARNVSARTRRNLKPEERVRLTEASRSVGVGGVRDDERCQSTNETGPPDNQERGMLLSIRN
jgi:hypothetical protein